MFNLLLRPVNLPSLGIAVAIMAVLALIFVILILVVAKFMAVGSEDEREKDVRRLLAGANCGGCGKAGCDDFAKALCKGEADLSQCNPTSPASKEKIAEILDIDFTSGGAKMAVVNCFGGNLCKDKFEYQGYGSCKNQQMLAGGRKQCDFGCMGNGDCVAICPENAIHIVDGKAVVNKELCIACGACVNACPKIIISLIPTTAKVYVACSSHCRGKEVMDACQMGCIGCGLCAKNCPEGAITMVDNLPVIDYSKCTGCLTCVAKCPKKTIHEIK